MVGRLPLTGFSSCGFLRLLLANKGYDSTSVGTFSPLESGDDGLEIVAVLLGDRRSLGADFLHDRVSGHCYPSINSSGVQIRRLYAPTSTGFRR